MQKKKKKRKKKKKKGKKLEIGTTLELSSTSPHVYFHNLLWQILSVCFSSTHLLVSHICCFTIYILGFPGGSDGKESTCNAGDLGSIPELGRSPGGGHGNSFQYSCLEHPHGQRSLEGYSPWGHKSSDTTERISTYILRGNSESLLWLSLNQSLKILISPKFRLYILESTVSNYSVTTQHIYVWVLTARIPRHQIRISKSHQFM